MLANHGLELPPEHFAVQIFLAAEMIINGRNVTVGLGRQFPYRGGMESFFTKQLLRRVQQTVTCFFRTP